MLGTWENEEIGDILSDAEEDVNNAAYWTLPSTPVVGRGNSFKTDKVPVHKFQPPAPPPVIRRRKSIRPEWRPEDDRDRKEMPGQKEKTPEEMLTMEFRQWRLSRDIFGNQQQLYACCGTFTREERDYLIQRGLLALGPDGEYHEKSTVLESDPDDTLDFGQAKKADVTMYKCIESKCKICGKGIQAETGSTDKMAGTSVLLGKSKINDGKAYLPKGIKTVLNVPPNIAKSLQQSPVQTRLRKDQYNVHKPVMRGPIKAIHPPKVVFPMPDTAKVMPLPVKGKSEKTTSMKDLFGGRSNGLNTSGEIRGLTPTKGMTFKPTKAMGTQTKVLTLTPTNAWPLTTMRPEESEECVDSFPLERRKSKSVIRRVFSSFRRKSKTQKGAEKK